MVMERVMYLVMEKIRGEKLFKQSSASNNFPKINQSINHKMNNAAEKKGELRKTFLSANTLQESLEAFKKMEDSDCFQDFELGFHCLTLATQLYIEGNNSEKVIYFGKKALKSLSNRESANKKLPCTDTDTFHPRHYAIVEVLNLLGSACLPLNRCSESLLYFERADKILSQLENEDSDSCNCLLRMIEITLLRLFEVKELMGRIEEAVPYLRKFSEISEKKMEDGCMELGEIYKDVYEAYLGAVDLKEALPFCLKALEIYRKHLGCESVEVARMMRDLGFIYSELGEYEESLEQMQLAISVMNKVAPKSHDLLKVELQNGLILILVGRYEEATKILRGVASHAEVEAREKASALIGMAKVSFRLAKFDDAKKYMRTARTIYEKEEVDPVDVACGFEDMSMLYAKMNDHETAILLVRRVLAIPKIPQQLLIAASGRFFKLVFVAGKEEELIPYMEDAVERLENSVGSKHYEVGLGCRMLGAAYLKAGQPELAIKCLTKSKDIMDVSCGPDHLESLETSHTLARIYLIMKRVEPAIEIEEKVVEGLKRLVPSEQKLLDEAIELLEFLNKMKEIMAGPVGPFIDALFEDLMR